MKWSLSYLIGKVIVSLEYMHIQIAVVTENNDMYARLLDIYLVLYFHSFSLSLPFYLPRDVLFNVALQFSARVNNETWLKRLQCHSMSHSTISFPTLLYILLQLLPQYLLVIFIKINWKKVSYIELWSHQVSWKSV